MKKLLILALCLILSFSLVACNGTPGTDGKDGKDGKTPYIENGYWYIDGENTGVKAEGVDGLNGTNGTNGKDGTDGKPGADGKDGVDGKDGADGKDGKDGVTPTIEISDDGYWVINGVKTEYKAVADGSGGDTHSHSFGEWVRYTYDANTPCDAWLYYRICSLCKDIEWQNGGYENHSFTTITIDPTCVAGGYDENTCSVCGLVETTNYTDIAGHSYKEEYSFTDSFHWLDCKYCDSTTSYAEHNIDDSGFCTVCNQPLAATEGILYDLSADGTYAEVIGYSGTATKIVIADTYKGVPVTGIYEKVFYDNDSITSVVIPDSVTSIGDDAFYSCSSLTSVNISDIAAWCNISFASSFSNPLYYAKNLYLNGELVTELVIPDSVTSIGDCAFYGCDGLTSVSIGNGVTSIGYEAFSQCSSLTSINVGTENEKYESIDGNLYSKDGKTLVQYAIGKSDTTFIIPNSVTSIGYSAFSQCFSLTSVSIGNGVASIGDYAFSSCISLTSITIPDSVTLIGDDAFYLCTSLTSVSIGNGVTSIGDHAFMFCSSLTSVSIGNGVTSIGDAAFYLCYNLTNVYYTGSEEEWEAISIGWYNDDLTNATIHYNYVPEEE